MKDYLLNKFEEARYIIINSIFECVNKRSNKSVLLTPLEDCRILEVEDRIITQKYKKLFIKDNRLMIEYEYGEGFEPYEYISVTEDLDLLSANEIYEIIRRIED